MLMRAWIVATFMTLLAWQPAHAQQLLTPREFVDAAVAVIQLRAPEAQIERQSDLTIGLSGLGDVPHNYMNFDYAYREYQNNPGAMTEIIDRWARLATQGPEDSQMRERVVSVLRPRSMIAAFEAQAASVRQPNDPPPGQLVWRPFAGDLVEVIVFDGAETIQYAMVESLAQIDITPEMAWAIAPGNLPARLGELEIAHLRGMQHLVYVTGGNGLAPSTLTDSRFCASPGGRNFIFLLVDRNAYLMADRTVSAALAEFRDLYQQIVRDGESMSTTPIACEGGQMRAVDLTD